MAKDKQSVLPCPHISKPVRPGRGIHHTVLAHTGEPAYGVEPLLSSLLTTLPFSRNGGSQTVLADQYLDTDTRGALKGSRTPNKQGLSLPRLPIAP